MGKLTISVALFSSYVRLPDGKRKKMCECADLIYIPSANPIYTSHLHTYHFLTNFKCVSKNDFMECGSKLLAASRFLWACGMGIWTLSLIGAKARPMYLGVQFHHSCWDNLPTYGHRKSSDSNPHLHISSLEI